MLKRRGCYIFAFVFLLSSYNALGQEFINDSNRKFEFTFENYIFNKKDYYYTNGLIVKFSNPHFSISPFFKFYPKSKPDQYDQYGFQFEQKFYTPTNTKASEVLVGDRPYSSYFLISNFKETRRKASKSGTLIRVGVGLMGRYTGGKQLQSLVHGSTPKSEIPKGWDNQLSSSMLIDINYLYSYGFIATRGVDLRVFGRARVGNLHDELGSGVQLRIGLKRDYYTQQIEKFVAFFNFKIQSSFIVYNGLLQGGEVFNTHGYVIKSSEINRNVTQGNIELNLGYNNVGIVLEQVFLAPEFVDGRPHSYGGIRVIVDF